MYYDFIYLLLTNLIFIINRGRPEKDAVKGILEIIILKTIFSE